MTLYPENLLNSFKGVKYIFMLLILGGFACLGVLVGPLRQSNPINMDFSQSTYILQLRFVQFLPAYGHSPYLQIIVCVRVFSFCSKFIIVICRRITLTIYFLVVDQQFPFNIFHFMTGNWWNNYIVLHSLASNIQ